MADTKATTVNGKVVNPRKIEWPVDTFGISSMLKKEGVRAAGRIKGDEAKLKTFLNVLKALGEHAKAKFADDRKVAEARIEAVEARDAALTERKRADAEASLRKATEDAKRALEVRRTMKQALAG